MLKNALPKGLEVGHGNSKRTRLRSVADPKNFGWGDDKNFKHKTSTIWMFCNQARSQKFAMEQLF